MKRKIKMTAISQGETAINLTASVESKNYLTNREASQQKERIQNALHSAFRSLGFNASEIKVR